METKTLYFIGETLRGGQSDSLWIDEASMDMCHDGVHGSCSTIVTQDIAPNSTCGMVAQDPIVSYSSSEFIYSTICSDDKTLLVRLIYCCVLVKLFNEVKVNSTVAWA